MQLVAFGGWICPDPTTRGYPEILGCDLVASGEFLDLKAVRDEIHSPTYLAGLTGPDTCAIVHPGKLALELAVRSGPTTGWRRTARFPARAASTAVSASGDRVARAAPRFSDREGVRWPAVGHPEAELGRDDHVVATAADRLAHQAFVVAVDAVAVGGVDECRSAVDGRPQRGQRGGVVDVAVHAGGEHHRPETDGRDVQIRKRAMR
jgi:hypothetical protein